MVLYGIARLTAVISDQVRQAGHEGYGMVWYGMVLYDIFAVFVAWYGVVWCGRYWKDGVANGALLVLHGMG